MNVDDIKMHEVIVLVVQLVMSCPFSLICKSRKIGDIVSLSMRQSSTKSQATNNKSSAGHHKVFNDGQNIYRKARYKRLKRNEIKLFIEDENRHNL